MENKIENKKYDMVNIMRMVCALLVVVIHTSAFAQFGGVAKYITSDVIARIAVPFFFVTSGFFLYGKINKEGYINKYIKKLVVLYLIITTLNVVILFPRVLYAISTCKGPGDIFILFIKSLFINGFSGALWYFPALIFSTIFVYLFVKRDWIKPLIGLSILFFAIGLMGDSYQTIVINTPLMKIVDIYNVVFDLTRNGFCIAVPFLTIGILISKYNLKERVKHIGILILIFAAIYGLEAYLVISNETFRDTNIYISLVFIVPLIFIWALNSKVKISDRRSNLLREMSFWVYGLHEIVQIGTLMYLKVNTGSTLYFYLMVISITIFIAYVISSKHIKEPIENKKAERRIPITCLIIGCAILASFFAPSGGKSSISPENKKLFGQSEGKESTNVVGILYKISDEDSSLYLYGGISYGTADMYPLASVVEEAIDNSDGYAIDSMPTEEDQQNIMKLVKYEKDELGDRVSEEAVNIIKDKIEGSKFKGKYEQIKNIKASYISSYVHNFYTTSSDLKNEYGINNYIKYKAEIQSKDVIGLKSPLLGAQEYFDNSKEEDNAYIMLVKYMGEDDYTVDKARLEAWKTGNIEATYYKKGKKILSNEEDQKDYDKYSSIIKENDNYSKNIERNENTKKIDELLKANKNYFVSIDLGNLIEENNVIAQLEAMGYKVSKVTN